MMSTLNHTQVSCPGGRAHCQSRIVSYRILARPPWLCFALPAPVEPAGQGETRRVQFACFHRGRSYAQDAIFILPLRRMRRASFIGGSVAHARSYARIDGRDQATMTRHILSTLAPIPPITRSQLLANRRAQRSSLLLTRHPHVLTAPSSQQLLISPRTLDPISFPPLVPTPFPSAKASPLLSFCRNPCVCFPLFSPT